MNQLSSVNAALASLRERIRTICEALGRDPSGITILAVTKGFEVGAIEAALSAGLTNIGENYYQEAAAKFAQVRWPAQARKHFIGRVQRNKVRKIAQLFDTVQTVDDLDAAAMLSRGAQEFGKTIDVLVQVNVASDERQGVPPEKVNEMALALAGLPHLSVRGIMAVGPPDRKRADDAFARTQLCFERLRHRLSGATILSMGMSDDMDLALAHGSTMLRIGSALFGSRTPKR